MFGFIEHPHTTLSSCTIVRDGHTTVLEMRRPSARAGLDYLVLVTNDEPIYLMYGAAVYATGNGRTHADAMRCVAEDCARLVAEPNVAFEALQWRELIRGDVGYGRDGGICMY